MSDEVSSPSLIPVVLWALLGMLVGLGGLAGVGMGVADSESAGVMAATVLCPVVAFGLATFVGSLLSLVGGNAVRIVVPGVVGVIGGVAGGGLTMMFFVVLWPML